VLILRYLKVARNLCSPNAAWDGLSPEWSGSNPAEVASEHTDKTTVVFTAKSTPGSQAGGVKIVPDATVPFARITGAGPSPAIAS